MFLTNMGPENIEWTMYPRGWGHHSQNVLDCSLRHSRPIPTILWNSIHPLYSNVTNIHTATPRWDTMKRSCQAWNCSAVVSDISGKFHVNMVARFSMIFLTNTDPKIEQSILDQGVNRNIPTMCQIVPNLMSHLYWKLHENPLHPFSRVMFLTDTDSLENI